MTTLKAHVPPKLKPLFMAERGKYRYRGAYGGRGSGKSYSFALMAAILGYKYPMRILCTREYQASIKESFHAEIKRAIYDNPWLLHNYDVGVDYLRGKNGTEFIFRGLRRNMSAIKSMAQIDLCIIEEAEDIPEYSFVELFPTVRAPKSEIWLIWNPRDENSPVDRRFRVERDDAYIVEMNYRDNPWFPEVLEHERQHDQKTMDVATYAHIWEGEYLKNSNAQILADKIRVDEFEPKEHWDGPYHGLDFGFANDPTTANRVWIADRRLYVEYEANQVRLELDKTAGFVKERIPGIEKYKIRADSARPESINYLQRNGLPKITGVSKWQGSVEDGIQHLRSYDEIVIHPRCKETIRECRLYSYKTDRLTGDVLPQIVDAHNHHIDGIRYAVNPLIKKPGEIKSTPVRGLI